jgi:hypothetical protein
MTTTELTTRQQFDRNIYNWARDLTTRELTGTKAWVIGVELQGIADAYDISDLSAAFLDNELKLRKSHFYLDGHNWSDFHRATSNNMIQIIQRLIARKERVGA